MTTFAENLKRARADTGLSQTGLARVLDVATSTVQTWEQGRSENPGLQTLRSVALALGCTVGDLVEGIPEAASVDA